MTREEVYLEIIGPSNWRTVTKLPTAWFERAEQLRGRAAEAGDVELQKEVIQAMAVLSRWPHFVTHKLTDCPPWDLTPAHWEQLILTMRPRPAAGMSRMKKRLKGLRRRGS